MDLNEYVAPELAVLVPILYLCGSAIKASKIPDYKIPFILGAIGIILANVWLFAQGIPSGWQSILVKILFGVTQGIICAAVSVYSHNLFKQYSKRGEESGGSDDKTD